MPRKQNSKSIGDQYESLALSFLEKNNLQLLDKNFHSRHGEIDLILLEQETLVFCEVRFRSHEQFGSAEASITPAKQKRIIYTAQHYLQRHPQQQSRNCRFDVIAITLDKQKQAQYHWLKAAFTE